ncbi:MAG TPA: RNA 2',3'-cyclic phosphodiesterase [Thermoplasmata archaeon]|nr:RNA 2',3'-cyclic phosphodiesterase [Thermoplasmata archaeon]
MTFRGFIAVDIPPSPSLESLAEQLRTASASLKVVSTDQLHLTVKFLGDTEEGLVPEIVTAIQEACADIRPFRITVQRTGAFPSLSRMNVVWVGVDGADPIARIAADLDVSFESLGFEVERRPWKAHVTLARVKGHHDLDRVRSILETRRDEIFGSHRVDRIHLKKSVLTPGGAQYSVVATVVFGNPTGP